ncbi:MAG: hypothetical protein NW224_17115 [Leptolyngbyaceae cyanobacterium bins.302]|nr:hypothetical protein [Leptolyngbyaceae cyanobacterium bins.302]
MSRKPFNDHYEQVIVETFLESDLSDNDYFLLFCLLHEYEFRQTSNVKVYGLTQRGASAILAALWSATHFKDEIPDKKKNPESDYTHWYWKWNTDWGQYEHSKNLNAAEIASLDKLKSQILEHGLIKLILKDDDL